MLQDIKERQAQYEAIKALPDHLFDGLGILPQYMPTLNATKDFAVLTQELDNKEEYGRNRRLILTILSEANRLMSKREIFQRFKHLGGKDDILVCNNALFGLSDNQVRAYKPIDFKMKGNLYGLAEWWDKNGLKIDYRPLKQTFLNLKPDDME